MLGARVPFALLCIAIFAVAPAPSGAQQLTPDDTPHINSSMSPQAAQQQLLELVRTQWTGGAIVDDPRVDDQSLSYGLKLPPSFGIGAAFGAAMAKKRLVVRFAQMSYILNGPQKSHKRWCADLEPEPSKKTQLCWSIKPEAQAFIDAINRMIWEDSPQGKRQREDQPLDQSSIEMPPGNAANLSVHSARKQLLDAIGDMLRGKYQLTWAAGGYVLSPWTNVILQPDHLELSETLDGPNGKTDENLSFNFSDMSYVSVEQIHSGYVGDVYHVEMPRPKYQKYTGTFTWHSESEAQAFADALNRLIWEANGGRAERDLAAQTEFKRQAAAWLAAPTKPAMPEEALHHKVLAENAVQEKNFDKAIDEYVAALAVFPTWPGGQYNVAIICGQTDDYDCALLHMQNYLTLVPDASDAQKAKEQIWIWQDKQKKGESNEAQP